MQGSPRIDELRQKFHENPRRYFAPLANEYRKAGDPEQAIAICRAHLAQQPGHMSGHVVYGQALYDAQRIDEARTVFEKALSLDPDNAVVLRKLGDIARQRGDSAEARHWYGRALDTDPHDTEVAAYIAELTEPVSETAIDTAIEIPARPVEVSPVDVPADPIEASAVDGSAESDEVFAEPIETEDGGESARSPAPESIDVVEVPTPAADEPDVATEAVPRIDEVIPVMPREDDVAWRNTPPHEGSPFVTRTMAELYAKQGYREAALDVYRQLALKNPDDHEIIVRIGELSAEAQDLADAPDTGKEPDAAAQPTREIDSPMAPSEGSSAAAVEESEINAAPAEHLPDIEADLLAWGDLASEPIYTPSSEELEMSVEPEVSLAGDKHFTETELPAGDAWDTDMWGAGFSTEESVPLEFDASDIVAPDLAPDPAPDPARATEAEATPESIETPPPESVAVDELLAQPVAVVAEPEPEIVVAEPEPEIVAAEPEFVAAGQEIVDAEPEDERAHFVAYAPEIPDEKDLAHYTPTGPTIREFFGSLGSRRPPTRTPTQSFTARAAVPSVDSPIRDEHPPLPDAFSGLFPNATVSDEDSRAAFALSGAMSGSPPGSHAPVPFKESIQAPLPAPPEPGQESEEDIRRFREWLDGLAES